MTKKLVVRKNVELKRYIARHGWFANEEVYKIPEHLKSITPEILLGRSIIDRAILDSLDDEEIEEWFDENDEDFNTICFIGNLNPKETVKQFNTILELLKKGELIENIIRS